jgi:serine-type D-Ala-D-Ala carboxypeptidase/endopeptidase (penicillin-binding protein 4)
MSTYLHLLFSLVIIFYHASSFADESKPNTVLWQKHFDELVRKSKIPSKSLGLVITRSGNQEVASLNADHFMTPASLTKIATAAAVLHKFPIGYQFTTELLSEHEPVGEILKGDLYLRGGGDPGFVSESMWFLVNEFLRSGVKEINGDIIVDDSFFDSVRRDPSRDQSAVDRAYDSPIGAMTFNWSSVSIFVRPSARAGEPARVFADPENDYIKLVSRARTTASGHTQVEATNETLTKKLEIKSSGETVTVTGAIPVGANEQPIYKSIIQPDIWAGSNLLSFLKQRGITVKGAVRTGVTPTSATVLATNKSKPIGELVNMMMKFSNNYIAEILTKDLGAFTSGRPGTMDKGAKAVREFLKEIGVSDVVYENPSGLSRKNSFRPRDLLRILQYVEQHFEIYPEYLTALPIGGVDGTLHKRMHQSDTVGSVRAKTGHLDGVTGLAGYVGSKFDGRYQFAFLYNGGAQDSVRAQELFDKILLELPGNNEEQK